MGHGLLDTKLLGQRLLDGAAGLDILNAVEASYEVATGETIAKGQLVDLSLDKVVAAYGVVAPSTRLLTSTPASGGRVHSLQVLSDGRIVEVGAWTSGSDFNARVFTLAAPTAKDSLLSPSVAPAVTASALKALLTWASIHNYITSSTLLGSDTVVAALADVSGSPKDVRVVAFTVGSGTDPTLTIGTAVTVNGGTGSSPGLGFGICRLAANKFAVVWSEHDGVSAWVPRIRIGTVSGTTITLGTAAVVDTVGGDFVSVCRLDADKALVVYRLASGLAATAVTVSGTTPTVGTPLTVTTKVYAAGSSSVRDAIGCLRIGTNLALIYSALDVYRVSVSGTTVSNDGNVVPVTTQAGALYYSTGDLEAVDAQAYFKLVHATAPHVTVIDASASTPVLVGNIPTPLTASDATGNHPRSSIGLTDYFLRRHGSTHIFVHKDIRANGVALSGGSAGSSINVLRFGRRL